MMTCMTVPKMPRVPKIERAQYHLEAINKAVRDFISEDNQIVIFERDPNIIDNYLVKIKFKSLPPQLLPLIVGDALQNLRSSLDHIALALTIRHSGEAISKDVERACQFPIIGDTSKKGEPGMGPQMWRSNSGVKIGMASPKAQRIIEVLQPYQRGKDFDAHPLWVLNELCNGDKHRVLTMVTGVIDSLQIVPGSLINCRRLPGEMIPLGRTVNGNIEIASIPLEKIDPNLQVGLKINITVKVVFSDILPDQLNVIDTLWEIHRYITEEVIPPLAPYLRKS